MKTRMKLFTLVIFLSLSTISKAQEATLEETARWMYVYGNELFYKSTIHADDYYMWSAKYEPLRLNYFVYTYKKDKEFRLIKDETQRYKFEVENVKTIVAYNNTIPALVFNFIEPIEAEVNYYNPSSDKSFKIKKESLKLQFKSVDGMMRYYKALKHLFELNGSSDTKFSENITLEDKF